VRISITTLNGRRRVESRAIVDTASTLLVIPPSMARQLGLTPAEEGHYRLGGKKLVRLQVADALVEVGGHTTAIRIGISPAVRAPVLGVTVLGMLGLAVDPVRNRLVPTEYLLKSIGSADGAPECA